MEVTYAILRLLLRLLFFFLGVSIVGKSVLLVTEYDISSKAFYGASAGCAVAMSALYSLFIYPRYLDPLRTLPLIKTNSVGEMNPIQFGPRGKLSIPWVRRYPDADMIRLNTFPGVESVILVSAAAFRDVLSNHAYDFVKLKIGRDYLARMIGYGLILVEGDEHRHTRKHLEPAFRIQNIQAQYPLMFEKTGIFLDQINAEVKSKGHVEIATWASRLTLDIIGPAAMSADFDSLRRGGHLLEEAFTKVLTQSPGQAFLFIMSHFFPQSLVKRIPIPTNRMLNENCEYIRSTCADLLKAKQASAKDISEYDILRNIITSGEFTDEEIVDQMRTFIGAGHETTAATLSWVTHLLTLPKYRHYQDLLRKEVQNSLPADPSSPLRFDSTNARSVLESLPYLNGICEETLRLFPSVTNTARLTERDTTVAGYRVPANTIVLIAPLCVNRNTEFWGANADEMVPERWIDTLPDGSLRANKHGGATSNFHNITFLHGPRSCIGKELAKAELRVAIAAMFGRFVVERLPGDDGSQVEPAGALTIKPLPGVKVTLTEAW